MKGKVVYRLIKFVLIFLLIVMSITNCTRILRRGPEYGLTKQKKLELKAKERLVRCVQENMSPDFRGPIPRASKVDSVAIHLAQKKMDIFLSKQFSYQPFRLENIGSIYQLFQKYLGRKFRKYRLTLFSLNQPIERLIPNFFQPDVNKYDVSRMPKQPESKQPPIIRRTDRKDWLPTQGLFNHNIALWHSHGFYYSQKMHRWEWQRPRLFSTVEDLLPMSFVIPYLVPMLENAGAIVFLPRERDLQTHEIIIDNDEAALSRLCGEYNEIGNQKWELGNGFGFRIGNPPYPVNFNPFLQGSFRSCRSDTAGTAQVEWIPDIPETGEYGVYISYHASENSVPDAHYSVYHSGGKTDFIVDQQIGGSTWLYLGQFRFKKGLHHRTGKVVLSNKSDYPGKLVTADAVRFGGGMGNISRGGRVSGYPRFAEAARYYLQYSGMPDTLVYRLNQDTSDYKDDYQSRGEFVNYLKGKPFGPNKDRQVPGLGIPVDLSLAFHTDAGITPDSTIGTLMIYSLTDAETLTVFPDSMSRLANRDLGDIIQTQLVRDIRLKYRHDWTRRALMDADYSEVFRPNVPSCLLELLSHQNFTDMKYALSPQFRFDVSRSIYKGMLKFIATQNLRDYVVQPLPVSHFHSYFSAPAEVTLRWQPVADPLEPTAVPEKYRVYTRINDNGFDNGALVDTTCFVLSRLEPGVIYSFKVTALNRGGESFPSEILSVCWMDSCVAPVLIVNGFDRIAPPEYVDEPNFKGFANFLDPGVADRFSFNLTGSQIDFDPNSRYRSNDAPGHGASLANFETKLIPGNSFDFCYVHGSAIRSCGRAFVSSSDESVMAGQVELGQYGIVDLILGEEKTTVVPNINAEFSTRAKINANCQAFPAKLREKIREFCDQGGRLFVSGAYVGTDLAGKKSSSRDAIAFAGEVLKINWQTDHAVATGGVFCVDSTFLPTFTSFEFNTQYRPDLYTVESPDAIDPAGNANTILRYSENRFGAATAYFGGYSVIVFGFPFESIVEKNWRHRVMKAVLDKLARH